MNSFVSAVKNQEARTENAMKARKSTANACTDLFFKIGASRGKDIIPDFVAAYVEDTDIALRIAAWVRDIRGGAGERQIFRDILLYLEKKYFIQCKALADMVPELGRWDDLLIFEGDNMKFYAFSMIKKALEENNSLCAKWMPRKGKIANELRTFLGWTPKFYRKRLVELTKVVETQMCAKDWDNINFSHVPSKASSVYKKAFYKNTPKYVEYVEALVKGDDPKVKVNANAIFPHDVLKDIGVRFNKKKLSQTERDFIEKQWDALPNYVGESNVLPLIDVSGSMTVPIGSSSVSCMDVAVSLGLYLADKNRGKFADTFLTFTDQPELVCVRGSILEKVDQTVKSKWGMSTNLNAAFAKILQVAIDGKVPQEEMPEILLILSDMQFDQCVNFDDSAMEMIRRKYSLNGYECPLVVFWNLNSHDNVPVKYDDGGVALVSGFSPAILTSILNADKNEFTPYAIMLKTVMQDRYDVLKK